MEGPRPAMKLTSEQAIAMVATKTRTTGRADTAVMHAHMRYAGLSGEATICFFACSPTEKMEKKSLLDSVSAAPSSAARYSTGSCHAVNPSAVQDLRHVCESVPFVVLVAQLGRHPPTPGVEQRSRSGNWMEAGRMVETVVMTSSMRHGGIMGRQDGERPKLCQAIRMGRE